MSASVKPLGWRRGLFCREALRRVALIALCASVTLPLLGCSIGNREKWKFASLDVKKAKFWDRDGKPDPVAPTRLATSWTEATLTRPGQAPQRGFGGRLLFYEKEDADLVRVDGQLVIYAFDETNSDPHKTEPTRRYIFPAEQFAMYESETPLGPSYSVWVPWDEAGGSEAKVSLIARFEPKKGAVVVGEQTHHYLAGAPAPKSRVDERSIVTSSAVPAQSERVTAASYNSGAVRTRSDQAQAIEPGESGLSTTTIALPRKLSATPGGPLRTSRAVAPGQVFTTPHMTGVREPGMPLQEAAASTSRESIAPDAPTAAASPVTTAGFVSPVGIPATLPKPGMPRSGDYQWPQRLAPGQQVGR